MTEYEIKTDQIRSFAAFLYREERAPGTIDKYIRDVKALRNWLSERNVSKEAMSQWKEHLISEKYAPTTINSMLAALNSFFSFMGWNECRVKFLKVQRKMFREPKRELSCDEYRRLVDTAGQLGQTRLALLMETICATGIRVSEVRNITVEAAKNGRTEISLKGKIRTILLPRKLCRKLINYAQKNKITSGEIFLTRSGKPLGRGQIWSAMKALCERANVEPGKVFPHNLRHLFATVFYRACKDISKLADMLGHSSIETTRAYLITSGTEHQKQLESLHLIS